MKAHAADPMQNLLRGAVHHGHLHVDELQADLHQMVQLISNAVERMSHSFARIAAAGTETTDTADAAREQDHARPRTAEERLADVADAARSMITELQFHDLISQVAARAQARLDGINVLLRDLDATAARCEQPHAIHHGVRLARDSHELARRLRKAVAQRDLDTGDIELF